MVIPDYTDLKFHFRCANYTFLLKHAKISVKTNPCSGSMKQRGSNGWARNDETMSAVFSFISP